MRDTVLWIAAVLMLSGVVWQWVFRIQDYREYHAMREDAERYRALRAATVGHDVLIEHGTDAPAPTRIASPSDLDWLSRYLVVEQAGVRSRSDHK